MLTRKALSFKQKLAIALAVAGGPPGSEDRPMNMTELGVRLGYNPAYLSTEIYREDGSSQVKQKVEAFVEEQFAELAAA